MKFHLENRRRKQIIAGALVILSLSMGGCAFVDNFLNLTKEKLTGSELTASVYDSYGNVTLAVHGKSMSLDVLDASSSIFDKDTSKSYTSTVLDVTIDGEQLLLVGDTVIFAEKGLDQITDFDANAVVSDGGGSGLQFLDRKINRFVNDLGKKKTIIISTQLGVPIGVYQGNKVRVEVPESLPKTTRLTVDGKELYIHRANYQIVDTKLLEKE